MNLYLLRHGPAGKRDSLAFPDDSLRPLTAGGEKQLRRSAKGMKRLGLAFDWIVASPLTRARQTAEIVAEHLGAVPRLRLSETLAPGGDRRGLVGELAELPPPAGDLLLVGHQPDLGVLLSLLTTGRAELTLDFRKGGLARLQVAPKLVADHCATLKWLLTPRQLRLIG